MIKFLCWAWEGKKARRKKSGGRGEKKEKREKREKNREVRSQEHFRRYQEYTNGARAVVQSLALHVLT